MLKLLKAFAFSLILVIFSATAGHAQAPTPTAQGDVNSEGLYGVAPGDTLYGISSRFGIPVGELISANTLDAGGGLLVGQHLVIPGLQTQGDPAAQTVSRARNGGSHTVAAGDTLYSIAQVRGVAVAELATLNTIDDPSQLRVGQVLQLPGSQRAAAATIENPAADLRHEVLPGQTLFSIARQHQVEVTALASANGINDPEQLRVGQVLVVPSAHGGVLASSSNVPSAVTLPTITQVAEPTTAPSNSIVVPPAATVSDPAQVEVVVATSSMTPIMLPNPPPRRGAKFHWPARGKILTRFGQQNNGQTADGIEIQVDSGAAVTAAEDGVVAFAGTGVSGYGYLVLIKHADDYYTAYGQNSAVNVTRGDIVQRGDLIARAGNPTIGVNGRLHFEVRYREDPVNPIAYMTN